MTATNSPEHIPTVVLYDIMHEAATRVRGVLVALQDQDPEHAPHYRKRRQAIADLVDSIDVDDRDAIARTTTDLRAEYDRLNAA